MHATQTGNETRTNPRHTNHTITMSTEDERRLRFTTAAYLNCIARRERSFSQQRERHISPQQQRINSTPSTHAFSSMVLSHLALSTRSARRFTSFRFYSCHTTKYTVEREEVGGCQRGGDQPQTTCDGTSKQQWNHHARVGK